MANDIMGEVLLAILVLFSIPIAYILFCLGRGVIDDIRKGVRKWRGN